MNAIVIPCGERMSRPKGEFNFSPSGYLLHFVETVESTRRTRLGMLVAEFKGLANLCEALELSRKETSGLSRILNSNLRHDRDGVPYNMGSPMARRIEGKVKKPTGWMDTQPDFIELHANSKIAYVMRVMEVMPEWQRDQAIQIIDTLARPAPAEEPPPTPPATPPSTRPVGPLPSDYPSAAKPPHRRRGTSPDAKRRA